MKSRIINQKAYVLRVSGTIDFYPVVIAGSADEAIKKAWKEWPGAKSIKVSETINTVLQ